MTLSSIVKVVHKSYSFALRVFSCTHFVLSKDYSSTHQYDKAPTKWHMWEPTFLLTLKIKSHYPLGRTKYWYLQLFLVQKTLYVCFFSSAQFFFMASPFFMVFSDLFHLSLFLQNLLCLDINLITFHPYRSQMHKFR
mgnify:CR=1 FL=1